MLNPTCQLWFQNVTYLATSRAFVLFGVSRMRHTGVLDTWNAVHSVQKHILQPDDHFPLYF